MKLHVNIFPINIELLGQTIGLSNVVAFFVVLFLILVLLLINRLVSPRFKAVPGGFQSVLEMSVDGILSFARGRVGHAAEFVAPVTMTLMAYVFFTTFVEIFGLPPATEDLNCTVALGICSFLMVNITGLKFTGVKGRLKNLSTPSPAVFPIKVMTDMIAPVSMGIRLFSNVLVGGVIMQLIYAVVPIVLPAVIASYFNLLHVMIQTFVFGLLSLTYISEAVE